MDGFEVGRIGSKEEMRDFVLDYCRRLGWRPGKMDHELNWAVGPEGAGMYIGRLNGKPITGVGMFQHNDSYAWAGLFFCDEEHRGKGFAFKTWKAARAALKPNCNLAGDALVTATHLYEKEGGKRAFETNFCFFPVSSITKVYGKMNAQDFCVSIKPATEVDFKNLKLYTEGIIGITFDRDDFLKTLITLPLHVAVVAVSTDGGIVGFACIRETINFDEDGYRLGPLLANSGDIGRLLLLELANRADVSKKFGIFFCDETNPDANKIKCELGASKYFTVVRMYSGGEVPMKKEKYFGLISPNLVG